MLHRNFNDLGFPIFGLYGVTPSGSCECMNPNCSALFKHPRVSNWQGTTIWDEEQLDCMEITGQLSTGYGVLCKGLIVVDVDARNGGLASYSKLVEVVPEIVQCGFIVETGSGGGSKHLYYKNPLGKEVSLSSHLKGFEGIDFKSSGFCVGAGSMHKSGNRYRVVVGSPDDISEAPDALIKLLTRTTKTLTITGDSLTVEDTEITKMLEFINPDCDYDSWIKCGMAIHQATNGSGFDLWNKWSMGGKKYPKLEALIYRWDGFGKTSNNVSIGTLIHFASENGYKINNNNDVTFVSDIDWGEVPDIIEKDPPKKNKTNFDPHNPPGLTGRISRWINGNSMYARENLSVAVALMLISSCGGMRYRGVDDSVGNLFIFCVAGSGTGKENILQSFTKLMRAVGITSAMHGAIKSEQEIARNIVQNQASFYAIDEFGETLAKIQGARKKSGSSSYLEGIVGALMSIYSKSNGIHLINNDLKKSVLKELQSEANALKDAIANNEDKSGIKAKRLESLSRQISDMDTGIVNPFLNILGFTAPSRFSGLLDEDLADNGFMARALIVREMEDNPRYKDDYKVVENPDDDLEFKALSNILTNLYFVGNSFNGRVERMGGIVKLGVNPKSETLLKSIREFFWELGEAQKERQGFVAYTRRGYEMVNRISLVLSMGENEISEEAILWAFEFVKRDMIDKITITSANTETNKGDALIQKILSILDEKSGISIAQIKNKLKIYQSDTIAKALVGLMDKNMVVEKDGRAYKGEVTKKYYKLS